MGEGGGRAEVACAGQHDRRQQVEDLGRRQAGRRQGGGQIGEAAGGRGGAAAGRDQGVEGLAQAGAVGAKGGVAHGP